MNNKYSFDALGEALHILNGEGAISDEELNWMYDVVLRAKVHEAYETNTRRTLIMDRKLFDKFCSLKNELKKKDLYVDEDKLYNEWSEWSKEYGQLREDRERLSEFEKAVLGIRNPETDSF